MKQPGRATPSELVWLGVILLITVGLRLYHLDLRPFHHDEAIHGWLAYNICKGLPYKFDPMFHGPLLYWSEAALFLLAGASDFTARLLPALFSCGLPLLCFFLRKELGGRWGWICGALFITLSPTFTYYGRFLAHDDYVAFFTLAMVVLAAAWSHKQRPWIIYLLALTAGLFIDTKACFYIHTAIFMLFGCLVLLFDSFAPTYGRRQIIASGISQAKQWRWHLLGGSFLFLSVYTFFYSSFFSNPAGTWKGIVEMLRYWSGQQAHPRLPGPVYYYLPRLLIHEPLVYLAIPGLITAGRRKAKPWHIFLAFWSLATLAAYSFAQEKVPWLLMHPLLPMALLAGSQVQELVEKKIPKAWVLLLLMPLLGWSLRENLWLTFQAPVESCHLLKYMETSGDVKKAAATILSEDNDGQIFVSGVATWTMAWYLRDHEVTYALPQGWEKTAAAAVTDKEVVTPDKNLVKNVLRLRSWWLPDYGRIMTRELYDYLAKHRTDDKGGISHFALFTRRKEVPGRQSEKDSSEERLPK